MSNQDRAQAGFTLVEMVVVLALTALVFSIGALGLSVLKGQETPLRTARAVARLMDAARVDALGGEPRRVTADLRTRRFSYEDGAQVVAIPSNFKLEVTVGRETVIEQKILQVHFLPDGTSSGAEILIDDGIGYRARVDVNWLSGLARVSDASH